MILILTFNAFVTSTKLCWASLWCYTLCIKFVIHSVYSNYIHCNQESEEEIFLFIVLDLKLQNQVVVSFLLIIQSATSYRDSIFFLHLRIIFFSLRKKNQDYLLFNCCGKYRFKEPVTLK